MYDLTELTGLKAESERTQVVLTFQIPTAWFWPGAAGLLTGLIVGALLSPLLGPPALLLAIIGPVAAVYLMVDEIEPPWKRIVRSFKGQDGRFLYCGEPIELRPTTFLQVVPTVE